MAKQKHESYKIVIECYKNHLSNREWWVMSYTWNFDCNLYAKQKQHGAVKMMLPSKVGSVVEQITTNHC